MSQYKYTANMIKGLRNQVGRPRLRQEVFECIRTLGILKPFRGGAVRNKKQDGGPQNVNNGSGDAQKSVLDNCQYGSRISTVSGSGRFNAKNKSSHVSRGVNRRNLVEIKTEDEEKPQLDLLHRNARSVNTGSGYAQKPTLANNQCEYRISTVTNSGRFNSNNINSHVSRGVNFRNLVAIKTEGEEKKQQRLNLLYLNARSVCNKTEMLANKIQEENVDICCIAETWLHEGDRDNVIIGQLCPTGYDIIHQPRKTRGGGVAVVYRNSLKMDRIGDYDFKTFEYLEVRCQEGGKDITLGIVYRPPSSSIPSFYKEFTVLMDGHTTTPGQLLLVGDFNLRYEQLQDTNVKRFHELIDNVNCSQLVNEETHERGHILDLVITRNEDSHFVKNLTISPLIYCDHYTIAFELPCMRSKQSKIIKKCRNLRDVDLDKMVSDLENSDLILNPPQDLDSLVSCYNHTLRKIFDTHAPVTEKEIVLRPRSPWYDESIMQAKRERRKAERLFRKSKTEINKEMFKSKQKLANDLVSKNKQLYYNDKIKNAGNDFKELFKISKELLCKKNNKAFPSSPSGVDLANKFGQYFSNKIANIRKDLENIQNNIDEDEHPTTPSRLDKDVEPLRSFANVSMEKVSKLIRSGNSKSCALDPMPTSFIKALLPVLLPAIHSIINQSLDQSYMPCALREAIVKPLIKKPSLDIENFKNYRPVSNLPYLGKLIESVVIDQIEDHLTKNKLHEPLQSAYTRNHSTETAVVRVTNDILRALDRGQCVYLVLLDLSAAFDTIDHKVFLSLLREDYGVTAGVADWMESYLGNRHQIINVNDALSDKISLHYGFPQGSKIGPFGFKLYTKRLTAIAKKHNIDIHLYADDTQLYTSFHPDEGAQAMSRMEACIAEIRSWMARNFLKLNDPKTRVCYFWLK